MNEPLDPRLLPSLFMEAFNQGDFESAAHLYHPGAIRVRGHNGDILKGCERLEPTRQLFNAGGRLSLSLNRCFVTGDTALLLTKSRVSFSDGGGQVGVAIDVARRGIDGRWRYLIDNPEAIGLEL